METQHKESQEKVISHAMSNKDSAEYINTPAMDSMPWVIEDRIADCPGYVIEKNNETKRDSESEEALPKVHRSLKHILSKSCYREK